MDFIDKDSLKLVGRCLNRNEEAWAELIAKNKGYILSNIIKALRAHGHKELINEAEDYFLEVIAKLLEKDYRNLRKYDGRAPLRFWLSRIALNHTYSRLRQFSVKKRMKFKEIYLDGSKDETMEDLLEKEFMKSIFPGETPIDKILKRERINQLEEALNTLSEEERLIIRLRFTEKKSQKEIADFMGKKQGTVGSILSRALKKLKNELMQ